MKIRVEVEYPEEYAFELGIHEPGFTFKPGTDVTGMFRFEKPQPVKAVVVRHDSETAPCFVDLEFSTPADLLRFYVAPEADSMGAVILID
jgi:hypothetical protein